MLLQTVEQQNGGLGETDFNFRSDKKIAAVWVLKKREERHLEAAQMKFLRHLLGITKLDKERINVLGEKREHRTK